jgi:hypothetical protein
VRPTVLHGYTVYIHDVCETTSVIQYIIHQHERFTCRQQQNGNLSNADRIISQPCREIDIQNLCIAGVALQYFTRYCSKFDLWRFITVLVVSYHLCIFCDVTSVRIQTQGILLVVSNTNLRKFAANHWKSCLTPRPLSAKILGRVGILEVEVALR